MPRKQQSSTEVEVADVATDVTYMDGKAYPDPAPATTSDPGPEFVTREEYDNAVRALRDEISDLKEQVADLSNVITAPEGAVQFFDIVPGDPEQGGSDEPSVPDYTSAVKQDQGADGIPWY